MTIADLAGPVLLQVLPTTIAVLLATSAAATLPFALPRFVTWLKDGEPTPTPHHHAPHAHGHAHAERSDERTHTYSI